MKLPKTLAIVACAGLLSAGLIGSASHAYAQDAEEIDQNAGAWSADGAGSADQSSPEAKTPPLHIAGCWSGDVEDHFEGAGTITFNNFVQKGKNLKTKSHFEFYWNSENYAHGPMKGSVSSTGFEFKGNAGKHCLVSGSGTGDTSAITGMYEFVGTCTVYFGGGTFSITPGCS
jgi:hypothetical protein